MRLTVIDRLPRNGAIDDTFAPALRAVAKAFDALETWKPTEFNDWLKRDQVKASLASVDEANRMVEACLGAINQVPAEELSTRHLSRLPDQLRSCLKSSQALGPIGLDLLRKATCNGHVNALQFKVHGAQTYHDMLRLAGILVNGTVPNRRYDLVQRSIDNPDSIDLEKCDFDRCRWNMDFYRHPPKPRAQMSNILGKVGIVLNASKPQLASSNDMARTYDAYFGQSTDGESIYHKMNCDRVNPRTIALIERNVLRIGRVISEDPSRTDKTLHLLDFGCGDGRYFEVFLDLARKLEVLGVKLKITGYDVSYMGLRVFAQKLRASGFLLQDDKVKVRGGEYWVTTTDQLSNISFRLIHDEERRTNSLSAGRIGNVDVSLLAYGVLNHIHPRTVRVSKLKMLNDLSQHGVMLSVASRNRFTDEQAAYGVLARSGMQFLPSSVRGDGDVVYARNELDTRGRLIRHLELPYHLYTVKELRADLSAAGFPANYQIEAEKLRHEAELVQQPELAARDAQEAAELSTRGDEEINAKAAYFWVEAPGHYT